MQSFTQSTASKVLTLRKLCSMIRARRRKRQRMVFTNGCFDILHPGHVNYLETAARLGDFLVVALNSDTSIRELKGPTRPINDQVSRARVMAGLQCVDFVTIFSTPRVTSLLTRLKPEIYVKGGDYTVNELHPDERQAVIKGGGRIQILPLWKGYSTTRTIRRLKSASF